MKHKTYSAHIRLVQVVWRVKSYYQAVLQLERCVVIQPRIVGRNIHPYQTSTFKFVPIYQ